MKTFFLLTVCFFLSLTNINSQSWTKTTSKEDINNASLNSYFINLSSKTITYFVNGVEFDCETLNEELKSKDSFDGVETIRVYFDRDKYEGFHNKIEEMTVFSEAFESTEGIPFNDEVYKFYYHYVFRKSTDKLELILSDENSICFFDLSNENKIPAVTSTEVDEGKSEAPSKEEIFKAQLNVKDKFLVDNDIKLDANSISNNTLFIILNDSLRNLDLITVSGCYSKKKVKNVRFLIIHKKDEEPKIKYSSFSNATYPVNNTLATAKTSALTDDSIDSGQETLENQFVASESLLYYLKGDDNVFEIVNGNSKKGISVFLCSDILVSINLGIAYSNLSDPDNIQIRESTRIIGMDTLNYNTLKADGADGKIKGSISASFYFTSYSLEDIKGFTFKPSINFGLGLSDNFIRDYFIGMNAQIGWGLNISAGYNTAYVDRVNGYEDFKFNFDEYLINEVKTFKTWKGDWYFGITIDARILASMLLGKNSESYNDIYKQRTLSESPIE